MRTQTNNAARALRRLQVDEDDVRVRIRHEALERPGMASYAEGDLWKITPVENGDTLVTLRDERAFLLSAIETIEIPGGLREARREARREVGPPSPGGIAGGVLDGSYDGPNG